MTTAELVAAVYQKGRTLPAVTEKVLAALYP
jgi:hypothetical protein